MESLKTATDERSATAVSPTGGSRQPSCRRPTAVMPVRVAAVSSSEPFVLRPSVEDIVRRRAVAAKLPVTGHARIAMAAR